MGKYLDSALQSSHARLQVPWLISTEIASAMPRRLENFAADAVKLREAELKRPASEGVMDFEAILADRIGPSEASANRSSRM